ncbi:MAG: putative bifunctional diguanylate cyclase/phosphodiesterase [Halorhodospira sp.]
MGDTRQRPLLVDRLFAAGPTVILGWGSGPGQPVQYASASLTEVLGYQPEALLGTPFNELIHPGDRPRIEQGLEAQIARRATRYEPEPYRLRHADGGYRWIQDVRLIEWDGSGQTPILYGYLNEITERIELGTQIDHHRFYDPHTGLPNRALLEEQLDHAAREGRARQGVLAVITLDLADFHTINDSLGHAQGDELLRRIGERLSGLVGAGDTVARLNGDKFGILLHRLEDADTAIQLAERIVAAVEAPYRTAGVTILVNVRTGVRLCSDAPCSGRLLLEQSEAALHQAKREGTPCRLFREELPGQSRQRLELTGDLWQALAEGQLAVHYQPQIDLYTGEWLGVEALVRWSHAQRGWISPGTFIPVAERSSLIEWLGRWVLEQACAQGRAWLAQGVAFGRVAVNVAARQVQDDRFVEQVLDTLTRARLPADRLELEITESLMITPEDPVTERLEALRRHGVHIAVDDFGTGYSSLSYLKDLPIDKLKIDRSFTQGLAHDHRTLAVTRAILALGSSLDHTVIAEGIEAEHERTAALAEGIRYAQGFLFARPAPADALQDGPEAGTWHRPDQPPWWTAQPSGFPLPERAV